ncbi:MAG: type III-B CRISPR module RAMP protein Cmr1 [Candidatus Nezhaarchaeales archaeon]
MSKSVVRLKLINTTPLLVGWYDPSKQDPVGIRATEIKGIWRWWCRAFIAGAMYDAGMLSGIEGRDVYLAPSKEEAEAISCIVGKILGLGYAGEKPAESSRFKLSVQAKSDVSKNIHEFRGGKIDEFEYQRIKLLTLKKAVEGIKQNQEFTLSVEKVREKYKDAEELALKILIVSLQLSGVGKGGRRGLGSLDITHIEPEDVLSSVDKDIAKFIKDVYEKSIEIVDNRKYQEICGVKSNKQASNKVLPPLPAVSKEDFKLYKVDARGYRDFVQVHQFFVRTERCRALYGEKIYRDDLRKNLDAWFLGLPREQKGTGYRSDHYSRRASPIFVTYHSKKENVFGQGIFVSVFLSGDWPKELKWVGGGKKPVPIEIDADRIKKARNVFIDEFVKYLMQKRLRLQEIRWY